jgi:hypothetical protein
MNHANAKPLFFVRGLDYPNQPEGICEIRFLAQRISDAFGLRAKQQGKSLRTDSPVGQGQTRAHVVILCIEIEPAVALPASESHTR